MTAIVVFILAGCALLMLLMLYLLPTSIASRRQLACGTGLIFLLNLCIGWTIIGWLVCLLWAALGQTKAEADFYARAETAALAETPKDAP